MRQNKYNINKETEDRVYDGIVFDSVVEMKYYRDVIIPSIESGEIIECERQKKYILQPKFNHNGKNILPIEYKSDFFIKYKDGRQQVIDIKGCPDAVAKLKRKMFWFVYPELEYIWVGYSKLDGGFVTYETIQQGRKKRKKEKKNKELSGSKRNGEK